MIGQRIILNNETQALDFPGVDMGGKMTVLAINKSEKILAIRIAGHKYWSGRGQARQYASPQVRVYRYKFLRVEKEVTVFHLDGDYQGVLTWSTGRKYD